MIETKQTPEVDGELCVHGLCASASCRKCVEACPQGAFVLDDDMLGFDESACDGCGLCRPACPEQAISLSFAPHMRADARDRLVVLAACDKTGVTGEGRVPCVHALTRSDIATYEKRDLKEVVLWAADCDSCPRGTAQRVGSFLDELNRWRRSRGKTGISWRLIAGTKDWHAALAAAPHEAERPDPARRRLLSAFRGRFGEADETRSNSKESTAQEEQGTGVQGTGVQGTGVQGPRIEFHRPVISSKLCNGCDACTRICPHDALRLVRKGGASAYEIIAQACSGCGLCVDVCQQKAIQVEGFGVQEQKLVPLLGHKCYKCGTPYHLPCEQQDETELCRICRANDPTAKLFQVYD